MTDPVSTDRPKNYTLHKYCTYVKYKGSLQVLQVWCYRQYLLRYCILTRALPGMHQAQRLSRRPPEVQLDRPLEKKV